MSPWLPKYKPLPIQAWAKPSPTLAPTWKVAETQEQAERLQRFMERMPTASLDAAELAEFQQLRLVRTVMHIIGQELNAVEPLSKGGTFEAIFKALSDGAEPEGMAQAFHVEGGEQPADQWKKMVWQCVLALRRLFEEDELTVDGLIEVHKIMMEGAYGSGAAVGEGFTAGLRSEPACAGEFNFEAPQRIRPNCEDMVACFNKKLAAGQTHPVQLAADLMFDLVTIHPFSNGNGRMCRMVFTYALYRCGFPLLAMYSSNHTGKAARKDYLKSIVDAQTKLNESAHYPMYSIAFYAVGATIRNAEIYFMGATNSRLNDQWTAVDVPSPRSAAV